MARRRGVPLQQIHEGAQLQPGDVGPAARTLHFLEEIEQQVAISRQAGPEGAVLEVPVQVFQLAQQGKQPLGIVIQINRQAVDLVE